jgi:4-methyl-5(b-hydroxyethyl)-thiazole monophosphate biosynthesis
MLKAAVILANGFEEVEAITPADFLNRAGIDVVLAGIGGTVIKGAHGISINAGCEIEETPKDIDCIIVPGGSVGAENIANSKEAISLIREMFGKGKLVAAICAAPAIVLQKTGIIKGKKVTCFPGLENNFKDCTFTEERVVVDGNIVTSRAAGTAAEFALTIIEILSGKKTAEKIRTGTLQK